jgi:hypothetical protein
MNHYSIFEKLSLKLRDEFEAIADWQEDYYTTNTN